MTSFKDRIGGYAAYHKHPKNKFTHLFGVPMVFYSPLIALNWIRFDIAGYDIPLGLIVLISIMVWYLTLDLLLGLIMVTFSIPAYYYCDVASKIEFNSSLGIFITFTIIGWAIQLVGHYFEGRKPALADNLVQSLMGPLFIVLEILFFFGLKKDLEQEVHKRASEFVYPN